MSSAASSRHGSVGAVSNGGSTRSARSANTQGSGSEPNGEPEDPENVPDKFIHRQQGEKVDRTDAWWSVGEFLEGKGVALTHQSAKFTLTGNRVFNNNQKEELWDLSDSLAELYETIQRTEGSSLQQIKKSRNVEIKNKHVDIKDWLSKDTSHGFIRVYAADMTNFANSRLVPLTLSYSVQQVAHSLGLSMNSIHLQLNGDIIRRMDPYEHPLVIQNEYLAGLGYDNLERIQLDGSREDLGYLIRFYAGKPMMDSTFSRNQLQAFLEIRKGGVLQNWMRRLCVLSGTRLLIYKDKYKRTQPAIIQLAKGAVEEIKFKGHDFCLKLTSTLAGERITHLSFSTEPEYTRWYKKCKKATDKLPTSADLSNCHLEFLPENIFVNDQLAMLNLRHNVLKERPIEEDIFIIGWLDDLDRFTALRSLNLADNNLLSFPVSICHIRTLVELNIASNKLEEIPPDVAELTNLQALHIHNNHLTYLPDEMLRLRKLFILVLAFNRFTMLPPVVAQMTNIRISEIENIIMAGNRIEKILSETLMEMKYVKKVDLRMNKLTLPAVQTMKFTVLEHLTHLDIRDNMVHELDLRGLKTLEYVNCERNEMVSLQLHGQQLKHLLAGHNMLEVLSVNPKPEWLVQLDVSFNELVALPEWVSDCFFLQRLNASHNHLSELPDRLFVDARKLKSVRVHHNRIVKLPAEVDNIFAEEILVHHNLLPQLPLHFLQNANKLRVFNATRNRLTSLPPLHTNEDLNKVQELYLTGNCLGDDVMEVIRSYPRLKVLHLAHNEIYNLYDSDLKRLEMLQELNISGNQLRQLPAAVGDLTKLVILRAHSNILQSLPELHSAKSLRVLDVGHNHLLNVSVTNLMASQLNLLDMSLNTSLKVDPKELKALKNHKSVCLVDLTGQNRRLPGLQRRRTSFDEHDLDPNIPWKAGFSETSGMRNKLCVGTLKLVKFGSENDAIFGMFDGGHNNEVPKKLLDMVPEIMREEMGRHGNNGAKLIKYTMLTAHRKLKAAGQKLGASAILMHVCRISSDTMNQYMLSLGNVGDVEAIICRHGEPLLLTRKFMTTEDPAECDRVQKSDGIITEDNKVNGVTRNTRLLGCDFIYPHVIPDPFAIEVALRNDDEFIIIANRGLWKFVSYIEAVEEIYEIGNPIVAAKHLQDIAQGYGSKENIAILVIRLNTEKGPSLARLKPQNREMSIDDVEAAAKHDALKAKKQAERELKLKREKDREEQRKREKLRLIVENRSKEKFEVPSTSSSSSELPSTASKVSVGVPRQTVAERLAAFAGTSAGEPDTGSVGGGFGSGRVPKAESTPQRSASEQTLTNDGDQGSVSTVGTVVGGSRDMGSIAHRVPHLADSIVITKQANSTPAAEIFSNDTVDLTNSDVEVTVPVQVYSPSNEQSNSSTLNFNGVIQDDENAPREGSPSPQSSPRMLGRKNHSPQSPKRSPVEHHHRTPAPHPQPPSEPHNLKPLPNQKFVKNNAAAEWEVLLQKRLSADVKDKELKQMTSSVSQENVFSDSSTGMAGSDALSSKLGVIEIDLDAETGEVKPEKKQKHHPQQLGTGSWRLRNVTNPWGQPNLQAANPAYSLNPGVSNKSLYDMTMPPETEVETTRHAKVSDRIALFEKLKSEPVAGEAAISPSSPTQVLNKPGFRGRAFSPPPQRVTEPVAIPRPTTPTPRPTRPMPPEPGFRKPLPTRPKVVLVTQRPQTAPAMSQDVNPPPRRSRKPAEARKTVEPSTYELPSTSSATTAAVAVEPVLDMDTLDHIVPPPYVVPPPPAFLQTSPSNAGVGEGDSSPGVQGPARRLPGRPPETHPKPSATVGGTVSLAAILNSTLDRPKGRKLPVSPHTPTPPTTTKTYPAVSPGSAGAQPVKVAVTKSPPAGSVENDLYAKVKRSRKDQAPPPPAATVVFKQTSPVIASSVATPSTPPPMDTNQYESAEIEISRL